MTVWFTLFNETRYWELEPYFDLDGGRAIALPGVEYIVYVEQPSGPIEVRVEKHGYEVRWINPATGEEVPRDNVKAEKIVLEPPDRAHDWVLQISPRRPQGRPDEELQVRIPGCPRTGSRSRREEGSVRDRAACRTTSPPPFHRGMK